MRPERKLKSRVGELGRRSLTRMGGRSVSRLGAKRGAGRPPMDEETRSGSFAFRARPDLRKIIEDAAASERRKPSDFVRILVVDALIQRGLLPKDFPPF